MRRQCSTSAAMKEGQRQRRLCCCCCYNNVSLAPLVLLIAVVLIWGDLSLVSHCSEQQSSSSIGRSTTTSSFFTRITKKRHNNKKYSQLLESSKKEDLLCSSSVVTAKAATPITSRTISSNNKEQGLLQVPCSVAAAAGATNKNPGSSSSTDLCAYVDTGATHTIIFYDSIKRTNLLHLMDRNPSFLSLCATSVGGEQVHIVGRIPAGLVSLVLGRRNNCMHLSPEIYVLERTGSQTVDMLLGLDILNMCMARICLQSKCLILNQPGTSALVSNDHLLDITARLANTASSFASNGDVKIPFMAADEWESITRQHDAGVEEDSDEPNNYDEKRSPFDFLQFPTSCHKIIDNDDWKQTEEDYDDGHQDGDRMMDKNDDILYYERRQEDDEVTQVYNDNDDDDDDDPIDMSGL